MFSAARTVPEYLKALPPDRRREIAAVRRVVRQHLPKGYEEVVSLGMIVWQVPLRRYPDTYNRQPLCYAGLAAQKRYNSLYLMGCYAAPEQAARLKRAFDEAGLAFDMGKSCVRFSASADLPLGTIGELLAAFPPDAFIARHEASRAKRRSKKPSRKNAGAAPGASRRASAAGR